MPSVYLNDPDGGFKFACLTSMRLAAPGPRVLTMWTFGVEVERSLCRD